MSSAWPWLAIVLLGAYHGLDPSMGWLFAVALGLQERRRSRVFGSLLPLAAGHLISIAIVVALIASVRHFAAGILRPAGATILLLFGVFRFFYPRAHPRWVAMRVRARDLVLWSFLMSTAHGAGLMLFPILIEMPLAGTHRTGISAARALLGAHGAKMGAMAAHAALSWPLAAQSAAVVLVHTGSMLIVMGAVAVIVYEKVGLRILRSAWINLDTIWAGALVAAGVLCYLI